MKLIASAASIVFLMVAFPSPGVAEDGSKSIWKAGAARTDITPQQLMWMSGYASRDKPAEGKLHGLWAKALVLEDQTGRRCLLITADLIGIRRDLSLQIRGAIGKQLGIDKTGIAICCSHTHTGPIVGRNLATMYFLDGEQQGRVDDYAEQLADQLVELAKAAIDGLQPARLSWGMGKTDFAVNRRNNAEADVEELRKAGQLNGPTDHDVPVLLVQDDDGQPRAVVFGYACHATVLSSYQWSGDYPGFAQMELEHSMPGCISMFWAGCGGDQNPLPRRSVELAQSYGQQLAKEVQRVLTRELEAISPVLATSYHEIELPFNALPSVGQLEAETASDNRYVAARAQMWLNRIKDEESLPAAYPYPIQCWKLGDKLKWIFLGGEVVVDYSLRLKWELRDQPLWVAAYANDVMAYIPSRRVLAEGGYEGGGAMVYYGLPSTWSPAVEEKIVRETIRQAQGAN